MVYINSKKSHIKPLKELNLINSFLFDVSMEDPENAATIARIIIKRATGRDISRIKVETQKELKGYETGYRGIQLDVIVFSDDSYKNISEVYDIEPNDYNEKDLAKRTRYYNSMVDVKLLKSQENFAELPELFSIWILSHDPFGEKRMVYTVKNIVTENPQLVYNDGVTNLFLYTGGTIGGSKELHNLLTHMTNTTDANAVDPDLKKIQSIVNSVKDDRKVGERYMSMEKIIKSATQDGFNEGRNEAILSAIEAFIECDISPEIIRNKLITKFTLSEAEADFYLSEHFK